MLPEFLLTIQAKHMKKINFFVFVISIVSYTTTFGQKINEASSTAYLRHGNAQSYMSPFVDLTNSSMQTAVFSFVHPDSAKKFHIYLGLNITAALVPKSMKSCIGQANGWTNVPKRNGIRNNDCR